MSASARIQFAWAIIIRGAAAIVLAILAFGMPAMSAAVLAALVGVYVLIDGTVTVAAGTYAHGHDMRSSPFVVDGVLGVMVGVTACVARDAAPVLLIPLVAGWGIIAGVFRIAAAVHVHSHSREWLLALTGAVGVALADAGHGEFSWRRVTDSRQ